MARSNYPGWMSWIADWYVPQDVPGFVIFFGQSILFGLSIWALALWLVKRHEKNLAEREAKYRHIHLTHMAPPLEAASAHLMLASVVLSHSLSRTFLANLKKLFGGRIKIYEDTINRGRREVMMRLAEEAHQKGIDAVYNIRFLTTGMRFGQRGGLSFEMLAYGTAVRLPARTGFSDENAVTTSAYGETIEPTRA
ncbi:MAG: heavy metal-binding domain-containing protein [Pseudomonadota bacterium]